MIKKIIRHVAESSPCQFQQLESQFEGLTFYKAGHPNHQRFLVVVETDQISTPSELNDKVQASTPSNLLSTPSFAKNTDLILLFRLDSLTELGRYEDGIFDIEENAYSLKKHVLYYTSTELDELNQYLNLGRSLDDVLTTPEFFNRYKRNPTEETAFSLACRLYVKLPFLSVPALESTLTSANQLADTLLNEQQLFSFFNSIEMKLDSGQAYHEVMEALVSEQMAD